MTPKARRFCRTMEWIISQTEMKRRSFLQSIIGGVTALFGIEEWPDGIPPKGTDEVKDWRSMAGLNPVMLGEGDHVVFDKQKNWNGPIYTCRFKGYLICALINRIDWRGSLFAKNPKGLIPFAGLIDLETDDVCQGLEYQFLSDCVMWYGKREVWLMKYIGGEQVFRFIKYEDPY